MIIFLQQEENHPYSQWSLFLLDAGEAAQVVEIECWVMWTVVKIVNEKGKHHG